jgi:SNF2 family DNA or RNA helicase
MAFAAEGARPSRRGDRQQAAVPWSPHEYQLRAVEFVLEREAAGLFLDPGLGKTSTVLAALTALKKARKLKRALVVAPLRVCHMTWPAEREKWADFHGLKMTVLHGHKKERLLLQDADVHVINPEGLDWLWRQVQGRWPYDVLVIDESTKFKSWTAQRTKKLRTYLPKFKRRWILTGTPAPNGIQDLFSQVFLLDGGKRLGQYITYFRTRFMIQGGYNGYEWRPKEGALEEIEALLKDIVLRLDAKDWLELPELHYVDLPVELPPAVRKTYEQLETEFLLELEKSEVTIMHAGVLGMKLRQVTNGFIFDDDNVPHFLHETKVDALEDLVEELSGQPLLVGVAFKPEVEMLRKRLGKDVPYLGGGVSKTEADRIVADWNDGKIPVLLAHPASVSHGLNLQAACRHVCWFGLTWNLEEYDQFIRRVYRQGQQNHVVVHNIVAKDTMDQRIARALRNKNATQSHLLEALKS